MGYYIRFAWFIWMGWAAMMVTLAVIEGTLPAGGNEIGRLAAFGLAGGLGGYVFTWVERRR